MRHASTAVLMSTYNGEKYIAEQIHSILVQLQPQDRLIIRDDGSSDETVNIIRGCSDERIRLIEGDNIGFVLSFLWLIFNVDIKYSIFLLADQDDIWDLDKVDRAYSALIGTQGAVMYCTRLRLVDENKKFMGLSPNFKKPPSFWNAACENVATGCTIALNLASVELLRYVPWNRFSSRQIGYHDWWIYLVVSKFGEVKFDPVPSMSYRQHGHNFVGMGAGIGRYLTIWRYIQKTSWTAILVKQLGFFLDTYAKKIASKDRAILSDFSKGTANAIAFHLIFTNVLKRQSLGGDIIFKCLVVYDLIMRRIPST